MYINIVVVTAILIILHTFIVISIILVLFQLFHLTNNSAVPWFGLGLKQCRRQVYIAANILHHGPTIINNEI